VKDIKKADVKPLGKSNIQVFVQIEKPEDKGKNEN